MATGVKTDTLCLNCKMPVGKGKRFCPKCGQQVEPLNPVGEAVGTERLKRLAALIRQVFMMFVNPGAVLREKLGEFSWPWALAVSGLAFTLFFLQTGLDLERVHRITGSGVAALALTGAAYGTLGISCLAVVAWTLCRLFGTEKTLDWSIRAFGLGFSPTLIYALIGLLANLCCSWNTAVVFGITGALWALAPINATIKEMVDGKTGVSIVLTSICGGMVLFGWSLLSA